MLTTGAGIPKEELKSRIVGASQYDQFFSLFKYFENQGLVKPDTRKNWLFIPQTWAEEAAKRDIAFIIDAK